MSREINLTSHHTLTIYILFLICDHTLSAQKPGTGDATPQKITLSRGTNSFFEV